MMLDSVSRAGHDFQTAAWPMSNEEFDIFKNAFKVFTPK